MKIYFVRHGESFGNIKKGFIAGRSDQSGLTSKGKSQIVKAAYFLQNVSLDEIFTSPVKRTSESAEIIGNIINKTPKCLDFLAEFSYGDLEGKFWWDLKDFSINWQEFKEDYASSYPNGESFKDVLSRVKLGWKDLLNSTAQKNIAVVSHQIIIGASLFYLKNLFSKQSEQFDSKVYTDWLHQYRYDNGAVIEFELDSNSFAQINLTLPQISENQALSFYLKGVYSENAQLNYLPTNSNNNVYLQNYPQKRIIKVMHDKQYFSAKRLVNLYRFLEQTPVKAPRVIYYDPSQEFISNSIIIQDFIDGIEQSELIDSKSEKIIDIQDQIFQAISKFHMVKLENILSILGAKYNYKTLEADWKLFLISNIEDTLNTLDKMKFADEKLNLFQNSLDSLVQSDYPLTPIHGDFSYLNIIVSDSDAGCKFERIIDFDRFRIGDKLWDLVYYGGFIERENQQLGSVWYEILKQNLSESEWSRVEPYRLLFHLWSVRDMYTYQDNEKRQELGTKSQEVLKRMEITKNRT